MSSSDSGAKQCLCPIPLTIFGRQRVALLHEPDLAVKQGAVAFDQEASRNVATVALQDVTFGRVAQTDGQDILNDMVPHAGILDGEQYFDPAIQVTRHEVGAAQIERRITVIMEVVYA